MSESAAVPSEMEEAASSPRKLYRKRRRADDLLEEEARRAEAKGLLGPLPSAMKQSMYYRQGYYEQYADDSQDEYPTQPQQRTNPRYLRIPTECYASGCTSRADRYVSWLKPLVFLRCCPSHRLQVSIGPCRICCGRNATADAHHVLYRGVSPDNPIELLVCEECHSKFADALAEQGLRPVGQQQQKQQQQQAAVEGEMNVEARQEQKAENGRLEMGAGEATASESGAEAEADPQAPHAAQEAKAARAGAHEEQQTGPRAGTTAAAAGVNADTGGSSEFVVPVEVGGRSLRLEVRRGPDGQLQVGGLEATGPDGAEGMRRRVRELSAYLQLLCAWQHTGNIDTEKREWILAALHADEPHSFIEAILYLSRTFPEHEAWALAFLRRLAAAHLPPS